MAVHIEKIVKNFSRYHEYTSGAELLNGLRDWGLVLVALRR